MIVIKNYPLVLWPVYIIKSVLSVLLEENTGGVIYITNNFSMLPFMYFLRFVIFFDIDLLLWRTFPLVSVWYGHKQDID